MRNLRDSYKKRKKTIKERLSEFCDKRGCSADEIFQELCFCILTPQSKAVYCDKAVKELRQSGLLLKGSPSRVRKKLKNVRFPNNKARYLVEARNVLSKNTGGLKEMIDGTDPVILRDWLVRNVKGIGYKEASHFLRNIGLGSDLAILDVHILKNLKKYRVIDKIPPALSRRAYIEIEEKMRRFSGRLGIPMDELDLLFWSAQTGFVFK
jgi:N-glycosylase/DNA lyase